MQKKFLSLSDFKQKIFPTTGKKFPATCENCILRDENK